MQSFGELELVMKLELSESRKLARVDVATVIEELQQTGFYLQVPPAKWDESETFSKEAE